MPPAFPSLLFSKTFEVQSSDTSFFVHKSVLTAQSEPLRSSITGVWKEAAEGKIKLLDWDSETVGRFVEFLYTEDYHVLLPDEPKDDGDGWRMGWAAGPLGPEGLGGSGIKDCNVLRAHAKVYALAQYKDVKALRELALEKLKVALGEVNDSVLDGTQNSKVAVDIIDLLDYVYCNTDFLTNSVEPMRESVSAFAAERFEKLMPQKEMGLLLADGGDLVADLMARVSLRVCGLEGGVQEWKGRASALEEKMWESAAANREEFQKLEASNLTKIRHLELSHAEKVRRLEISNMNKVSKLNDTHALKVRQVEADNGKLIRQLEEEVQKLQDTSDKKVLELEVEMRRSELVNRKVLLELELQKQLSEVANAEKEVQLEVAKQEVSGLEASTALLSKSLQDERARRSTLDGPVINFLSNMWVYCSAISKLGFRGALPELEGKVDEWMLKESVFMYLILGTFVIYLVVVAVLVLAVMGAVAITMDS